MKPSPLLGCAIALALLTPGVALAETCHRMPAAATPTSEAERISEFGRYEGYSEAIYDSYVRTSFYLPMSDGVRLATDVMVPAIDCVATDDPLPVLWTFTPYKRAYLNGDDPVLTAIDDQGAQDLVRHGYVIAAAAIRGTAASFGAYHGLFAPIEAQDAYEITEWLANQPFSNGRIGMIGGSYQGITQLSLAALDPPHLEAIFPIVVEFDTYDSVYPGGIFRHSVWNGWAQARYNLDMVMPSVPVDDDPDGLLLAQARNQHWNNWPVIEALRAAAFHDYDQPSFSWTANNLSTQLDAINEAAIPMYQVGGWNDVYPIDTLFWVANYAGPQRLMMGPWTHNSKFDPDAIVDERNRLTVIEELRWFDYWLKDIDNGIMDEEAVNYTVLTGPDLAHEWRQSPTWPPADIETETLYLSAGNVLSDDAPTADGVDSYLLDYTATRGPNSRFYSGDIQVIYDNMAATNAQALTYVTEPLAEDMDLIGFPVITLYVSSTANDGDFHVFLSQVEPDGTAWYVTEGLLRASQRQLAEAPYENYGLPYQTHARADVQTLVPGEVTELNFYLVPTSIVLHEGNRLALAIMGADADNTVGLVFDELPTVSIHHGPDTPSAIALPIQH
ncbi:MAG: CocE/NonD family hydrolase [Pseudomonadota bacterium]